MKPIPINYKEITDSTVCEIGKSVQRLTPIIEELGDSMEIEVEDYVVIIKRKDEKRDIMTWQKYWEEIIEALKNLPRDKRTFFWSKSA